MPVMQAAAPPPLLAAVPTPAAPTPLFSHPCLRLQLSAAPGVALTGQEELRATIVGSRLERCSVRGVVGAEGVSASPLLLTLLAPPGGLPRARLRPGCAVATASPAGALCFAHRAPQALAYELPPSGASSAAAALPLRLQAASRRSPNGRSLMLAARLVGSAAGVSLCVEAPAPAGSVGAPLRTSPSADWDARTRTLRWRMDSSAPAVSLSATFAAEPDFGAAPGPTEATVHLSCTTLIRIAA